MTVFIVYVIYPWETVESVYGVYSTEELALFVIKEDIGIGKNARWEETTLITDKSQL